jgi:hypothetical protein
MKTKLQISISIGFIQLLKQNVKDCYLTVSTYLRRELTDVKGAGTCEISISVFDGQSGC